MALVVIATFAGVITPMRSMRAGSRLQAMSSGMTHLARTRSRMEKEAAERDALYASKRWQQARREFLRRYPFCECGNHATVVDHKIGHRAADWRTRFWDPAGWVATCEACHNKKSALELADWRRNGEA